MTDRAWIEGSARLRACTQDREMDEAMRQLRAAEYRKQLGHLSDEQWSHAVDVGCRGFFLPSIDELLRWAGEIPYRYGVAGALPAGEPHNPRSEEQQAINAAGLKLIRETLAARGIFVDDCAKRMPSAKP